MLLLEEFVIKMKNHEDIFGKFEENLSVEIAGFFLEKILVCEMVTLVSIYRLASKFGIHDNFTIGHNTGSK